jgi:toxin ParE1/3/4
MQLRRIVLSNQADADLSAIFEYSIRTWGEEQALRYKDQLEAGLSKLAAAPALLGRPRMDLPSGYCSYLVQRHLVIFRYTITTLEIARILHARMDLNKHDLDG